MQWIEDRAVEELENFRDPDTVYMSPDVLREFQRQMQAIVRGPQSMMPSGVSLLSVFTSAGRLDVKLAPHFTNFCYVGNKTSFDYLEWVKVSQEFEKAFFGEDDES